MTTETNLHNEKSNESNDGANKTSLLDQGYLQLIETWGSDERIIESARMSTAKGFLGWGPDDACLHCEGTGRAMVEVEVWIPNEGVEITKGPLRLVNGRKEIEWVEDTCPQCAGEGKKPGDEKLMKFLWDKGHATPFEMAGFTIEVKAPLMVFREWHRHRTQSYNEMSARYIPLPDEDYMPTVERILLANNAGGNKQAQGTKKGKILTEKDALDGFAILAHVYDVCQNGYEQLLEIGWPKELARLPVTVGRYSAMRASANLRNWLGFMKLRCDTAAQWEIRQYANEVSKIVRQKFPRTYEVAHKSLGL